MNHFEIIWHGFVKLVNRTKYIYIYKLFINFKKLEMIQMMVKKMKLLLMHQENQLNKNENSKHIVVGFVQNCIIINNLLLN
jgi:hypothetical protein